MQLLDRGQLRKERRDSPRYSISAHGRVWASKDTGQTLWGHTTDISRFGLAFVISRRFANYVVQGEPLCFELEVPLGWPEAKVLLTGVGHCIRIQESGSECTIAIRIRSAKLQRQSQVWKHANN
jgi:hypothetical protein